MSFSHDCFASVMLGVLLGNLIVYDFEKCVACVQEKERMSEEELLSRMERTVVSGWSGSGNQRCPLAALPLHVGERVSVQFYTSGPTLFVHLAHRDGSLYPGTLDYSRPRLLWLIYPTVRII